MNKYFILFLSATALVSIAAISIEAPVPDERFENLKILPKNITEQQLDSAMDHYKTSLGVKCSFCHADGPVIDGKKHLDFISDAKPEKIRTREMIQMTNYLNETFFNPDHSSRPDTIHEVVCYTCHRGTAEPDANKLLFEVDSLLKLQHRKK